jgi:hypothetical protein
MNEATASTASAVAARASEEAPLAPCVAVIGPANSGKTTLLHLLDAALQLHPEAPLVYAVKGNPDGTGRYLFHAPELREALKPRVKGAWTGVTMGTIGEWIDRCRERLELVLVDVGGMHSPSNAELFARCTHALVVARRFEDEARERAEGMESWVAAARDAGLRLAGRVRSLWREGDPWIATDSEGAFDAGFRADASTPEDTLNHGLVTRLAEALLELRVRRPPTEYLDLRLPRDWTFDDLSDLGGLAPKLEARGNGPLVLGGRAPIWAYAAALHRALDQNPHAVIEVFDPKTPLGLVPIPEHLTGDVPEELASCLSARWRAGRDEACTVLEIEITSPDHFLPPSLVAHLPALPRPEGEPPAGPIVVSGAGPIWLHLAYSRWLRSLPGERPIGLVDAGTKSILFITGPGSPSVHPWELE